MLRHRVGQGLAALLCLLFSIAMVLNIHPIGDGLWFWYATLWRQGHLLYADMHLPLQPLFVLMTASTIALFGKSWLAGKLLAAAQALVYCLGLFLIESYSSWTDVQKALVATAAFAYSLTSFYSRFDDYHITGYIFEIGSLYLLLRLIREHDREAELWTPLLLGVFSGLSIGNRLNDGGALFAACALVLPLCVQRRRIVSLAIFLVSAPLTLLALILATGDSVRNWAMNSIVHAAAIKGGTGNVLVSPILYPLFQIAALCKFKDLQHEVVYALAVVALIVTIAWILCRSGARRSWWRWPAAGVAAAVLSWLSWNVRLYYDNGGPVTAITMAAIPVVLLLSLYLYARILSRFLRRDLPGRNPALLLLLIPILQMPGTTLSSRGGPSVLEIFPQMAYLLLLLPVVLPQTVWKWRRKAVFLAFCGWMVVASAITKTWHPYRWHHFIETRMFAGRVWYRHPVYGPMYIKRNQLALMQSMCGLIHQDGQPAELLTLPIPYANYFCNVAPWHGYVQTWYDTTSKQTIDTLIGELEVAPPKWIIYQRALDTIGAHERVFNDGKPLPQRALDALIVQRIESGQWRLLYREPFDGADWIVIKTRP